MSPILTTLDMPGGGSSSTRIAEDVLADQGGVVRKRGTVSIHQHMGNGFDLARQHMDQNTHRPAPSIGDYPAGLWLTGTGAETDGYGSLDSGSGTYFNMDRAREDIYVTQSWWWAPMGPAGAIDKLTFYQDTEGWRNSRRSYFAVELNLLTRELRIRPDGPNVSVAGGNAGVSLLVATDVPVPEWNDNKFDNTYCSLTTWVGKSSSSGTDFGRYVSFQIGSTVYDLRGAGGGSAAYTLSSISQPGSGFAGGRNPGLGVSTPTPGVSGGVCLFRFVETFGDSIAA